MLNVALNVWSEVCKDNKIKILCDNLAVVEFINSGKTRDPFLATCVRNIWLSTAIFNIQLVMVPLPGKCNVIADSNLDGLQYIIHNISLTNSCHIIYG